VLHSHSKSIGKLQAVPTALRGAFQSCGQNCAGAERFIVQRGVYPAFVRQVVEVVRRLRQGPPLGGETVDCGAMCLPGLAQSVEGLVKDAVEKGATVSIYWLMGGERVSGVGGGDRIQSLSPVVGNPARLGLWNGQRTGYSSSLLLETSTHIHAKVGEKVAVQEITFMCLELVLIAFWQCKGGAGALLTSTFEASGGIRVLGLDPSLS
jgi:hypothetical protein